MEKTSVFVKGHGNVTVRIIRKKCRNIYIRVKEGGIVQMTCPIGANAEQTQALLVERADWIGQALDKIGKMEGMLETGADGQEAVLFGKRYPVRYVQGTCEGVSLVDGVIVYTMPIFDQETAEKLFYDTFGDILLKYIQREREKWDREICDRYHIQRPKITIKKMKSRWGSCTPAKSHISMSLRLVHYPVACMQYVLLHEYAHFLVQNHGKEFYRVVERYMPQYQTYRKMLK